MKIEKLVRVISDLKGQGREVVLVSSGAIAAGRQALGGRKRPETVSEKQAYAAVGQARLMMVYGVLAVIVGVIVLVAYGTLDGTWDQLADSDGTYYGLTLDQTRSALMFIGIPMVLSGLCALVSGFMTGKREGYRVSLLLCILASVLPLFMALGLLNSIVFGIVLCVIGLYVTSRLYNNSQCFAS